MASARTSRARDLGYPRLDKFGEAFGGHGEHVTRPDDIDRASGAANWSGRGLINRSHDLALASTL